MARKNLLQSLMEDAAKPADAAPATTRPLKGAIGAVSQSIEALKARSLVEIDPFLIDAGGLQDRLETDDAEDAALRASIDTYGQQVPVLVRPHPDDPDRYQIVYGRRRVLALRDLGQPVKALVRDLDEHALVMAQGQENNARRGLSFIEKANFAAQMQAAGYNRKAVCDALSIDKTVVSRMLNIVEKVGIDLIQMIGAAPAVGRDRWSAMAAMIEDQDSDLESLAQVVLVSGDGLDSNQRFDVAMASLQRDIDAMDRTPPVAKKPRKPAPKEHKIKNAQTGDVLATIQDRMDRVVLTLPRDQSDGFEEWLVENLAQIHQSWATSQSADENPEQ